MMERLATTPFGGARFRADIFCLQQAVTRRQERLKNGEGGNDTGIADKWQLLRALTEARVAYGLSDRAITVLEALTSFHTDRMLDGSAPIIVFPSNAELSLRTRGMSGATLRRHLAVLVDAGLILRRDSANGKRFCRRDDHGQVESAFGFDLAPLALAAAEIHAQAEAARSAFRALQRLRSEITLHLRDIAKTVAAGLDEGRAGDWMAFAERLAALSGRISRAADTDALDGRCDALVRLRSEVENAYINSLSEQEMSGNESVSERRIQNSNTDSIFDLDGQEKVTRAETPEAGKVAPETKSMARTPGVTLAAVLVACPQIADYARDGIRQWRDLLAAATLVRPMLGISPDAWAQACAAMGDMAAAVTIAAILERAGDIRSAGGYLRDLTRKAEAGRFSVGPMLKALSP